MQAASCSGVNNNTCNGGTIGSCVVSDNTTSIIDNGNDNSCVALGNPNSRNVNCCEMIMVLQLTILPVSLVILPAIQFLMILFLPTLMIRWI